MKKTNYVRQVVFPLLAAFIWGTAFIAQDVIADYGVGVFTYNALRSYIAILVLPLIILLFRRFSKEPRPVLTPQEKKAARRDLLVGGFCCGTALTAASCFQQGGIILGTDGGKAGFLTAIYIVLVPIAGIFLKKRVSLPVWIGAVLGAAGLYLLCIKGDFTVELSDLLVLVCAICYTVHIYVIDHFVGRVDGMLLSWAQFATVAFWATLGMLIFEHLDWSVVAQCILPLLYIGIFSSCGAYTLQILAQKGTNPTVVTILMGMESVFAVVAGAILLHQTMTGREYVGCLLMLAAVLLAQIPFPEKKKPCEDAA
ncbi:MAG: DMT family transporter [Oscillospiraceae bacterium]|nr:DMT family transporter [Oscillospiraceae bacterium]